MENPTYPAWKQALIYGVYLSIALIILSLIFYVSNLYTESWSAYFSYAVILGGVIISAVQYRNKVLNGFISYGKSVSVGFLTGLFAAIILQFLLSFFCK